MGKTILQIPLFILIVVSYYFILKSVLLAPFLVFGLLLSIWHKIRRRELAPRGLSSLARFECISLIFLIMAFILCFILFRLRDLPWLKLWESPLLLALLLFVLVHQAGHLMSYNPILRPMASAAVIWSWPIIILLTIGLFAPRCIRPGTFQWAILFSAFLLLLAGIWSLSHIPTDIQSFESLDRRRNTIGESLEKLQRFAKLIGDAEKWKTFLEIISRVDQCYSQALKLLRRKRFEDADALIIQAEVEVIEAQRTFQDRILLSLRDEIEVRLKQAEADINNLKVEFENAGLSAENLSELSNEINILKVSLKDIEVVDESFINKLEPFESLFREIVDTRTALRFRENVSFAIDKLHEEVEKSWSLVKVAECLGLDVIYAENQRRTLDSALESFRSAPLKSSRELVGAYQSVQKESASFRGSILRMDSIIKRKWNITILEEGRLSIYIPKTCSTNEAVRGAVIMSPQLEKSASFVLDGRLLEVPEGRIAISAIDGVTHRVGTFTFVGRRGGKGLLSLHFNDFAQVSDPGPFTVKVNPSVGEMARYSLMFGVPVGGIGLLALWSIDVEVKECAWLGGGIGGLFSLLIFLISYVRHQSR